MNKHYQLLSTTFFLVLFISCEQSSSYEQINDYKTIEERIGNLRKPYDEVKNNEDVDALIIEEHNLLEYDFPIRKNESYVVTYRFKDSICFSMGLSTYFNKQIEAKKVVRKILNELEKDSSYHLLEKKPDYVIWNNMEDATTVKLNLQHEERGIVSLITLNISIKD